MTPPFLKLGSSLTPQQRQEQMVGAINELHRMVMKTQPRLHVGKASNIGPPCCVTVRMPTGLREALKAEAHDKRISLNQLCVQRLRAK